MYWLLMACFVLVAGLYFGVTGLYVGHFVHGEEWRPRLSRALVSLAIATHLLLLIGVGAAYGELPLVSKENFFSFLALSLVGVYVILESQFRVKTTGVFVFVVASLLHLLSMPMVTARPEIRAMLQNPYFGVHVVLAIFGYTSFLVSVVYGGLYLALYRQIRSRRFGLLFQRIPPLDLLSRMNAHAAVLGLACLTISILLGVSLSRHLGRSFFIDPTFLQSLATWAGYMMFAVSYYLLRWRGLRQVYCSMGSFAVGLISIALVLVSFRAFHTFG